LARPRHQVGPLPVSAKGGRDDTDKPKTVARLCCGLMSPQDENGYVRARLCFFQSRREEAPSHDWEPHRVGAFLSLCRQTKEVGLLRRLSLGDRVNVFFPACRLQPAGSPPAGFLGLQRSYAAGLEICRPVALARISGVDFTLPRALSIQRTSV